MLLRRFISRTFSTATVKLPEFEFYKLDSKVIPSQIQVSKEELLKYWEQLVTIRRLELASDHMYKNREIKGFCHLAIGQEAGNVGIEAGLTKKDHLITAYRCHGNVMLRGLEPKAILAEMASKITGSSKGKGGSMHIFSPKNNFWGGNAIVGAHIPVGTGIAYAIKYKQETDACVAIMFGDGASNQGQGFEAMNIAGLNKLPVIYICENNNYAYSTAQDRHSHNPKFYTRGDKIPGIRCNGMNVLSVREAIKYARSYCLNNGPIIVEVMTYRYQGHSMADTGAGYRTKEEVDEVRRNKDCINILQHIIEENTFATKEELKAKQTQIRQDIEKLVQEVRKEPSTPVSELFTDVYVKPIGFVRGVELPLSHHY